MKWLTNRWSDEANPADFACTVAIGDPEASDVHSVEALKKMGVVGVYEITPEDEASVQIKRPPLKLKLSQETPF